MKRKTTRLRIIIAALLGASYGVIDVVLRFNRAFSIIACVVFSFLMCMIAFWGTKIKGVLTSCVLLLGVGAALGGTMSLIYSLLNKIFADVIEKVEPNDAYNGARFFLIASVTAIVSVIFARIFSKEKENKTACLKIEFEGEEYTFEALVDSGNKLCDPLSQKPVILFSDSSKLSKQIRAKDDKYKRFIPYKDVSGKGILKGVIPGKIYVNDNLVDGVLCPTEKTDFSGFDALVPSCFL